MRCVIACLGLVACGFTRGTALSDGGTGDGARPVDITTIDAPFATGTFDTPIRVDSLSTGSTRDDDPTLTADMLEIFFESDRTISGNGDIYTSRRASINDAWPPPTYVAELSSVSREGSVNITADGLTIFLTSDRLVFGAYDIYVSTRADRTSAWSQPVLVTELNVGNAGDYDGTPSPDLLRIDFGSSRRPGDGGEDIFTSIRSSTTAAWSLPTRVSGVDTAFYELEPFRDATGAMWFTSDRTSPNGIDNIFHAEPDGSGGFTNIVEVTELSSAAEDGDPWVSPDGRTIYFTSMRLNNSTDIYMATRSN